MSAFSLDHLVGGGQQRFWDGEAERLGGFEIDDKLEFGVLLHWQVGRPLALENSAGIGAGYTVYVQSTAAVAHQAAGRSELVILKDGGYCVAEPECGALFAPAKEKRIGANHERACPQLDQGCEDRI